MVKVVSPSFTCDEHRRRNMLQASVERLGGGDVNLDEKSETVCQKDVSEEFFSLHCRSIWCVEPSSPFRLWPTSCSGHFAASCLIFGNV
jgi:hypothetical protein